MKRWLAEHKRTGLWLGFLLLLASVWWRSTICWVIGMILLLWGLFNRSVPGTRNSE